MRHTGKSNRWSTYLVEHKLEVYLAIAVVALVFQIAWPSLVAFAGRPRPGVVAVQSLKYAESGRQKQTEYLIYLPFDYKAKKNAPLVVFLHGAGSRGDDIEPLRSITPIDKAAQKRYSFILVAPQCPRESRWKSELVMTLIDELSERFTVDKQRVYLTGYSMGGFGTWSIGAEFPDRFAALLPIAGGGDPSMAEHLHGTPIHACHGQLDEVISVSETKKMVEAVRDAGGTAQMTLLSQVGHDVARQVYEEERIWKWLLSHSLGN